MVLFVTVVGLISWGIGLYFTGTYQAAIVSIVFATLYALFSYFTAGKAAVAINGAKEVTKKENPRLYRTVENLAITEGMPMPKVYVMEDSGLNAFATGRNPENAIVAATTGLLDNTTDQELEAVMAHELGHVKNYDIRVAMISFALVSVISMITQIGTRSMFYGGNRDRESGASGFGVVIFIASIVIAPIVANLLRMAVSRKRELLADATGALTTRNPEALVSALTKIHNRGAQTHKANSATAHLFFANPLKKSAFAKMFSTHPSYEDRVAALRSMATKL